MKEKTLEDFTSDKANREKTIQQAKKMLNILIRRIGDVNEYEVKDIVDNTTISYKESKTVLELFLSFGLIKFTKGSHRFRFILDDEEIIENFQSEIIEFCNDFCGDFKELLNRFYIFVNCTDLEEEKKIEFNSKLEKILRSNERLLKTCKGK